MRINTASLLCLAAFAAPMAAQQVLGILRGGDLMTIPLDGGRQRDLGACGLTECTAMTLLNGSLVIAGAANGQPRLITMNQVTGEVLHSTFTSERFSALFEHPHTGELFGVVDRTDDDGIALVSAVTGQVAVPRSTGFGAITAVGRRFGELYAWDRVAGLLELDPDTGVAIDRLPDIGSLGAEIAFLFSDIHGQLFGGRNFMFAVSLQGFPERRFGLGADYRGAVPYAGSLLGFGQPCGGAGQLAVLGDAIPDTTLEFTTRVGARLAPGVLYLGASRDSFAGVPLPISLDGLLGQRGCQLLVSPDVPVPMPSDLAGDASLRLRLRAPGFAVTLHAQHFALVGDRVAVSSGVSAVIAR